LLDRLAGGGAVLAAKLKPDTDSSPTLLVVQGRDAELMRKFVHLALQVAEQELARQESKERPKKGSYRDMEMVRIGDGFHAAGVGATLLISNKEPALHKALDLHRDGGSKSLADVQGLRDARQLLPSDPLVLQWLNLDTVRRSPQAKDVFDKGRDPNLTILFGGWLDIARRASFLASGLYADKDGLHAALRLPVGLKDMGPELTVHAPPLGQPGTRPLLTPQHVLLSHSFYLDAGKFWDDRAKIFTAQQLKGFEDFDKNSGRFLVGMKFSQFLNLAGTYHRFVAVHQAQPGYKKKRPQQLIPAFAVVSELRKPEEFSKSIDTVLRGVALLAGNQYKPKLVETMHGPYKLVGYRFPEDAKLYKEDPSDYRFNFSPCFVTVGNQFIASSTLELGHELIDLVEKENQDGPSRGQSATFRTRAYGQGGAAFLKSVEDQLLVQTILREAAPLDRAREQVKHIIDLVQQLGPADLEINYGATDFRVDARLKLTNKGR
jgi:hypothetical protein